MTSSASPPPDSVRIPGFYCVKKDGFSKDRKTLNEKEFVFSVKEFKIGNLEAVDLGGEFYFGTLFSPVHVTAFVDVFGSPIPFFVKNDSAKKLKKLLSDFAGARSVSRV